MIKFEEDSSPDIEKLKTDITIENEVLYKVGQQIYTDYSNLVVESPRICSLCDNVFINSYSYLKHNLTHLAIPLKKIHSCTKCSKWFPTGSELRAHTIQHTSKQKCHICHKFVSYNYLQTHIKNVHSTVTETCTLCSKVFKTPYTLNRHIMYVHDGIKASWRERVFDEQECVICKRILSDRLALKMHVVNCHSAEAECDVCGKMFTSKAYRNIHKRRVHDYDGEAHTCLVCGRDCKSKRRLHRHRMNAHKGIS